MARDEFVIRVFCRIEPKVCFTPVFHAALHASFDDGAGYQYAMNEAYVAAYDNVPLAELKNYRDLPGVERLLSDMSWFAVDPDV